MAAHGGFRLLELGTGPKWSVKSLLLPKDYLHDLERHVLLGFSGISRTAQQHAKKKLENIKRGKTTEELQAITCLAQEALKAFQGEASFEKLGRLLDQSWQQKRRLAAGVSIAIRDHPAPYASVPRPTEARERQPSAWKPRRPACDQKAGSSPSVLWPSSQSRELPPAPDAPVSIDSPYSPRPPPLGSETRPGG